MNLKKIILLSLLIVITMGAFGQGIVGNYLSLTPTTLPSICSQGTLRFSGQLQFCNAINQWTAFGALANTTSVSGSSGTYYPVFVGADTTTSGQAINVGSMYYTPSTNLLTANHSGAWSGNLISSLYGGTGISTAGLSGVPTVSGGNWALGTVGALYGGTGISTATSSGIPTISGGNWSIVSALSTLFGGTNNSALSVASGTVYYGNNTQIVGLPSGTAGNFLKSNGAAAPSWATPNLSLTSPTYQSFLQSAYYSMTMVSGTWAANQIYSNSGSQYTTVYPSTVSGTRLVAYLSSGIGGPQVSGILTYVAGTYSGNLTYSAFNTSGTYFPTSPAILYAKIKMAGGGGGGGAGNNYSAYGTSGTASMFGSGMLITYGGNQGGPSAGTYALGGGATLGSGPVGLAIAGGAGAPSQNASSTSGGEGGANPLGGAGGGGGYNTWGGSGVLNTGAGGGGGGAPGGAPTGGGGGAGGFVDAIINGLSTWYPFSIGQGGSGVYAGGGAGAGGSGALGGLWIEEHYQ